MNFYQHHIGDFNNATRHLSRIERSIYRDLLEIYYDTESPLTSDFDRLARRCIVDDCDRAAMRDVLNEFFVLQDDGYHNARADKEIAAYKRMAEGGKRGANKRWGKGSDSPPIAPPCKPHTKANANHEPITNNHEPVLTPLPPSGGGSVDAKFESFWMAYPKKVGKGATRKAWDRIRQPAATLDLILIALEWQAQSEQWAKNSGQYIPNPATYLNQQRWLDERPITVVKNLTAVGQKSADAAIRWLDSQGFQLEKTA